MKHFVFKDERLSVPISSGLPSVPNPRPLVVVTPMDTSIVVPSFYRSVELTLFRSDSDLGRNYDRVFVKNHTFGFIENCEL